jgi:hypothetical protein
MASFFTFDPNFSTIASEFRPNPFFGNAFSEIFWKINFDGFRTQTRCCHTAVRCLGTMIPQVPAGGGCGPMGRFVSSSTSAANCSSYFDSNLG